MAELDPFRSVLPHSFTTGDTDTLINMSETNPGGVINTSGIGDPTTGPNGTPSPSDTYNTSPTDTSATNTGTNTDPTSSPSPSTPSDSMTTSSPAPTSLPDNAGSNTPTAIGAVSSNHGLSSGAVAGVVISVLIILGVLGALFFFWWRRRNGGRTSFRGTPLSGDGAYTEKKPRSRPTSRYAQSTPAPDLLPRHTSTQSVGTVVSDLARSHESHGTLANVDDDADYLAKLEEAEAPIGSMTSGTTLTHAEPFLGYDYTPAVQRPEATKARDTRNRRSTGDAIVVVDHNYHRYSRSRSRSQELSREDVPASPTTYPPVPVPSSPPTSPSSPPQSVRSNPSQRKTPRKKPVPRYSAEGSGSPPPRTRTTAAPAASNFTLPPEFEGMPVHYLIPDMPAPQR